MNVACPKCGGEAQRDPDTMDTFVCSSWYYLRYLDPHNTEAPFDKEKARRWLPIDLYIGGITHATGHLIYFRFFHKFLQDIGWVFCPEPAERLFNHGMVCDSKGEVMSKSKGNVTSPIDVMHEHGVDIARLAMFFTAPSEREVIWSSDTVTGVEKFLLNRLWPLPGQYRGTTPDLKQHFKFDALTDAELKLYVKLNQTIKRVTDDFGRLQFNTSIAALMELLRDYDPAAVKHDQFNDYLILKAIQLAAPLTRSAWPQFDPDAIVADMIEIGVQVNGKLRDSIQIDPEASQEQVEELALASPKVQAQTENKQIVKKIYVKGRIFNIVVKG
jgi:leucyl-tRNA synthetase